MSRALTHLIQQLEIRVGGFQGDTMASGTGSNHQVGGWNRDAV